MSFLIDFDIYLVTLTQIKFSWISQLLKWITSTQNLWPYGVGVINFKTEVPLPLKILDIKFGQYNSGSFRKKLKMFNGGRKHIAKGLLTNSGD